MCETPRCLGLEQYCQNLGYEARQANSPVPSPDYICCELIMLSGQHMRVSEL